MTKATAIVTAIVTAKVTAIVTAIATTYHVMELVGWVGFI